MSVAAVSLAAEYWDMSGEKKKCAMLKHRRFRHDDDEDDDEDDTLELGIILPTISIRIMMLIIMKITSMTTKKMALKMNERNKMGREYINLPICGIIWLKLM